MERMPETVDFNRTFREQLKEMLELLGQAFQTKIIPFVQMYFLNIEGQLLNAYELCQHINIRDPDNEQYDHRSIFLGGVFTAISQMQALPLAKLNPLIGFMKLIVKPVANELKKQDEFADYSFDQISKHCQHQYYQYLGTRINSLESEKNSSTKKRLIEGVESKIRRYAKLRKLLEAIPYFKYHMAKEKLEVSMQKMKEQKQEMMKIYWSTQKKKPPGGTYAMDDLPDAEKVQYKDFVTDRVNEIIQKDIPQFRFPSGSEYPNLLIKGLEKFRAEFVPKLGIDTIISVKKSKLESDIKSIISGGKVSWFKKITKQDHPEEVKLKVNNLVNHRVTEMQRDIENSGSDVETIKRMKSDLNIFKNKHVYECNVENAVSNLVKSLMDSCNELEEKGEEATKWVEIQGRLRTGSEEINKLIEGSDIDKETKDKLKKSVAEKIDSRMEYVYNKAQCSYDLKH